MRNNNTTQKILNGLVIVILVILTLMLVDFIIPDFKTGLPERCKIEGTRYNGECLYKHGFILNMDTVPFDLPH